MKIQKTHAVAALALAGALTVTATTPSSADSRWGYAAGGFAAGAIVGAAVANANAGYYYGPGYAYQPYAYDPGPAYVYEPYAYETYAYAPAPRRYYTRGYSSYGYAPGYSYYGRYYTEKSSDPDPRIGGSFRMRTSSDD